MKKQIERIYEYLDFKGIKPTLFAKKISISQGYLSTQFKRNADIGGAVLEKIIQYCEDINPEWLLTGKGNMLRGNEEELPTTTTGKLIPLYDDVSTIGGANEYRASTNPTSQPTEYIDAGDWFKEATAAIRHYGESMMEYPTGCILALKEVQDRQLVIPGRDYVIETSEYRVTKRIKISKDKKYIIAHSTNNETYPDGTLVHEPFEIPFESITHISLVLGYVVKKNGGTMVFNNRK